MSAIFKNRKVPRHLVIEQELPLKARPRLRPWRLLLWLLLLLCVTGLLLRFLPPA
jgi:hypothetical protein